MFFEKPLLLSCLGAAVSMMAVPSAQAAPARAPVAAPALLAGAGKAGIVLPPDILPFQGFGVEHDRLQTRVLLLNSGGEKAAVVVLDMTSLSGATVSLVRDIVQQAAGIAPQNVLVVASHTFSAPHILGGPGPAGHNAEEAARTDRFAAALASAVREATAQATKSLRPATLAFGQGCSNVNLNRNVETAQGWWLGASETGSSDKSVLALRFEDEQHRPIAVLANYAVQSAIMDQVAVKDGGKAITADLAGAAMDRVESQLGEGAVSLFLIGAAGDQVPTYTARRHVTDVTGVDHVVDMGAEAYPLIALQGERLGSAVLAATSKAAPVGAGRLAVVTQSLDLPNQERPREIAQIKPTHSYTYQVSGHSAAPYTIVTIGNVALVGVQVELSATTGAWIKAHSPYPHTMVATMVNGAAKYLPDAESYRRFTYEAMNSSYAPGSGEVMAKAIVASLVEAHGGKR